MRNIITIILCLCAALAAVLLRTQVYEIPLKVSDKFEKTSSESINNGGLAVHYHERRPYYMTINGEVHGLVADPVDMVFGLADIDFNWVETPAGRQIDIIRENNSATCAAGWFKTRQRQQFAKYTLPVYQDNPFVGITRVDNSLLSERETLDKVLKEGRLRLLVKSGYSYGSYIDGKIKKYEPWLVNTTGDNTEMLQMLYDHRADYCFMTEEEAYDTLLFSGVNKNNYKLIDFSDMPKGSPRYLICSMMTPDIVIDNLNSAIKKALPKLENQ